MCVGEKKFTCEDCGKKFMRSDHLQKHKKTHQKKSSPGPGGYSTTMSASGELIMQTC